MRYSEKWPEYAKQWDRMEIKSNRKQELEGYAQFAIDNKARYCAVESASNVPWPLIAVLHRRESDADFNTYLGNGEPLNRVTRLVPRGRGPFGSFVEGAIDALKIDGLSTVIDWRLEKMLYYCELFNGAGYNNRDLPSPYIWGGTNIQQPGKYIGDGRFSPSTWDSQPGCAPILAEIARLDPTVKYIRESADSSVTPPAPVIDSNAAWVARIVASMQAKVYRLDKGPGEINIIYAEGHNRDGTTNQNLPGYWNDVRMVIAFQDGVPFLKGQWTATTQPGPWYTEHPINELGAANIKPGQYSAWRVGLHRGQYEALVQRGTITLTRDRNQDYKREGDIVEVGAYEGINQHHGSNADVVGPHSAGCLVGKMIDGHQEFMTICKSDPRYQTDRGYMFTTTVLAQDEIVGRT